MFLFGLLADLIDAIASRPLYRSTRRWAIAEALWVIIAIVVAVTVVILLNR